MCASSCVKPRARMRPCTTPESSWRYTVPNSEIRMGRSRYERTSLLKISTWPGQFMGLTAYSLTRPSPSSISKKYMFSP